MAYLKVNGKLVMNEEGQLITSPEVASQEELLAAQSETIDEMVADTEVLQLVEAFNSGSPKEVFATLGDLNTKYPNGTNGVMLVIDNGHWYYYYNNAWTDGGVYQASRLEYNSIGESFLEKSGITPAKTSFFETINENEYSIKLSDYSKTDGYFLGTNGNENVNSIYSYTDYIKCESETEYSINLPVQGYLGVACYDSKNNFISSITMNSSDRKFITVKGTNYIKISNLTNVISKIIITKTTKEVFNGELIKENSVSKNKTDFIVKKITSHNVFDSSKIIKDTYMTSNGNIANENGWNLSEKILVKGATKIYANPHSTGMFVTFFSNNNEVLGGYSATTLKEIDVIENATYMYVSVFKASLNSLYINLDKDYGFDYYNEIYEMEDVHIKGIEYSSSPINENVFDSFKVTNGFYVNGNGTIVENSRYCYSNKIDCSKRKELKVNMTSAGMQVTFYKDDDVIGNGVLEKETKLVIPSFANSFIISMLISVSHKISVYLYKDKIDLIKSTSKPFYIVDIKGNGDFKRIDDCVKACENGSIIYVYPGNYVNEIIEANGKVVHIIGASKNQCIISNSTGDYQTPPIEICAGTLKNLTIIAYSNSDFQGTPDYAVHADDNILINEKLLIDNCKLISEVNASLGMGLRGGCEVEVRNTDLIGTTTYGLFFHDSPSISNGVEQNVSFINCNVLTESETSNYMRIDSQEIDGSTINVTFQKCFFRRFKEPEKEVFAKRNAKGSTFDNDFWQGLINFNLTKYSFGNNFNIFNYGK